MSNFFTSLAAWFERTFTAKKDDFKSRLLSDLGIER